MRFERGDVRDHIVLHKNDHGPSYRPYRPLQRSRRLKIDLREIFEVVRFSTFATQSARNRHADCIARCPLLRVPGQSRKHMLALSFSGFDPQADIPTQNGRVWKCSLFRSVPKKRPQRGALSWGRLRVCRAGGANGTNWMWVRRSRAAINFRVRVACFDLANGQNKRPQWRS
jgi:hypothetical protein